MTQHVYKRHYHAVLVARGCSDWSAVVAVHRHSLANDSARALRALV